MSQLITDDYSESIDWDKIYDTFHNTKLIADRIHHELKQADEEIIFCGFPAVASHLSSCASILFVDSSPAIATRCIDRYPDIMQVRNQEIAEVSHVNQARQIVISVSSFCFLAIS